MKKISTLIITLILLTSCGDDDLFNSDRKNVNIRFTNRIASEEVNLNSATYQNFAEEDFSISELKYIISNIEFVKANGDTYSYPKNESFFLINQEDDGSKTITLKNIPIENFQTLRFGIGVDQSKYPLNGVLNFIPTAEENQMLWSWSAGYIFFKMEGNYTLEGGNSNESFLFHIGSHGTSLDNYKVVELSSEDALLNLYENNLIRIEADVLSVFNAAHEIRINDKPDIQIDPENAPKVAENVSQLFSLISE